MLGSLYIIFTNTSITFVNFETSSHLYSACRRVIWFTLSKPSCVFVEKRHCLWESGTHRWGVWMAKWPWGWRSISSKFYLCAKHRNDLFEQNVYPNSLFQEDLKKKAAIEEKTVDANEEKPTGVPEFWLTIFRSVDMLSDMLQVNQQNIRYSR